MKAKDLAVLLMKTPEAEVVFDDCCTEYIYSVTMLESNKDHVSLTWDLDKGFIEINDKLVEC